MGATLKALRFLALLCGLLLGVEPALAETTTYSYDALGRLVGTSRSSGAASSYTYDAAGNRTQMTQTGGSSGGSTSELLPYAFTTNAQATYYYTSNSDPDVLRDGATNSGTTSIAVYLGSVTMDLGSISLVSEIKVRPIDYAYQGWGPGLLNGAIVEYSANGTSWTSIGTISGATEGADKSIAIGAAAQYIRITSTTASSNQLGLGEFRAYGTSAPELLPYAFTTNAQATYYYTSNSDPDVLRDGATNSGTTSIAVYLGSVTMDLGSISLVSEIKVRPIDYAYQGWGPGLLNGAIVEYSANGTSWTSIGTISGATEGADKSIAIGAAAQYIRITSTTASSNQLGLGEFRAYGN